MMKNVLLLTFLDSTKFKIVSKNLKLLFFFQTIFTQYQVKSNNALILDTLRLSMCVAD